MALTNQKRLFAERVKAEADLLLTTLERLQRIQAEWNQNDYFNQITDADLQEDTGLAHLTAGELVECINAFNAVITALGDYSSGQAVNLIKMRA